MSHEHQVEAQVACRLLFSCAPMNPIWIACEMRPGTTEHSSSDKSIQSPNSYIGPQWTTINNNFTCRNFLLFMPSHEVAEAATTLRAVFTFYSDIVTLTSEGDSVLNDETLQSLGTNTSSFIQALFGSILSLASPRDQRQTKDSRLSPPASSSSSDSLSLSSTSLEKQAKHPSPSIQPETTPYAGGSSNAANMESIGSQQYAGAAQTTANAIRGAVPSAATSTAAVRSAARGPEIETGLSDEEKGKELSLIKRLPLLGYFVAGAVAGGVSRTCTAPLDRLKVYLLVDTRTSTNAAIEAAKKGRPVLAITNGCRSLWAAMMEINAAGGLRGFFAGMWFTD
jgi:solute carrier family 25 phosphate transporter 23/24/25/41